MERSLSRTSIALHWLVAITIVVLATVGLLMKYTPIYSLYETHKSLGILALLLVLPRAVWRLVKGWPKPLNRRQALQHRLAKVTHWVLLSATLLMPLSGMLLSEASGHGFGIFSLTLVPANHSALDPGEVIPYSEWLASLGYSLHTWVGFTLVGAFVLHLLGALKHHFIDKDVTLARMLGRA